MESYWVNEQEVNSAWLVNSSEAEDVLDWIKNIGVGAAQGAGTGAAAGPWGALVGGLIGGGLSALQQATQPQAAPQRPSPAPAMPSPAPQPVPQPATQPAAPTTPSPAQPATQAPPAPQKKDAAVQQFIQLLPQLLQIVQAMQPKTALTQQNKGRVGESFDGEVDLLAGDRVPDGAFIDEQETLPWIAEDDKYEYIEKPEPLETTQVSPAIALLPVNLEPPALPLQNSGMPTQAFPGEWTTEAESAFSAGPDFQWIG